MGLVLTLRVGEEFSVAGERFALEAIHSGETPYVTISRDAGRRFLRVGLEQPEELLAGAQVRLGRRVTSTQAQLDIIAPKAMAIWRPGQEQAE